MYNHLFHEVKEKGGYKATKSDVGSGLITGVKKRGAGDRGRRGRSPTKSRRGDSDQTRDGSDLGKATIMWNNVETNSKGE